MEVSRQLHAPDALPPEETASGTHCIGGWTAPRAELNAMTLPEIEPDSLAVQPVA
jgi:hypothetical protein